MDGAGNMDSAQGIQEETWLGFDGFSAYAHLGLERLFYDPKEPAYSGIQSNHGAHILFAGHLLAVKARLALVYSVSPNSNRVGTDELWGASAQGSRFKNNYLGFGEISFQIPLPLFDQGHHRDSKEGLKAGWGIPLEGNANAKVFGNYLARYYTYLTREGRSLSPWDSMGALIPRIKGASLSIGRKENFAFLEMDLVHENQGMSLIGTLTGSAPGGLGWGIGFLELQFLNFLKGVSSSTHRKLNSYSPDSSGLNYTATSLAQELVYYKTDLVSVSLWASFHLDDLIESDGLKSSKNRYGNRYGGIFAEVALLGWKSHPGPYQDELERLAWTAGVNVPTFGWLDRFALQVEWRRDPMEKLLLKSIEPWILGPSPVGQNEIPQIPSGDSPYYRTEYASRASPWKWGIYLSETFLSHFGVQFQATYSESSTENVMSNGGLSPDVSPFASRRGVTLIQVLGRIVFRFG